MIAKYVLNFLIVEILQTSKINRNFAIV